MGVTGWAAAAASTITTIGTPVTFDDLVEDVANRARIGVEARVLYDDNLLRLREDSPEPPDRSRDDVRASALATVDVAQRVSLQRVFLRGIAGYDVHRENDFLNRERIDLSGGVQWRVASRCAGEASLRYGRGQSNLEDLGQILRNTRESRAVVVDGGCGVGVGWQPEASFRHRRIENAAAIRRPTDLNAQRIGLGFSYNRTGRTSVAVAASQEDLEFPNRPLAIGGTDSARLRSVTTRLTHRGANLIASGVLGYTDADSRNPAARDFSGFVGGASLALVPGGRFRLTASAGRSVDANGDVPASYYIADAAGLVARYRLGRAVDLEVGGDLERRRFRSIVTGVPGARTFDETLAIRAGAAWSPLDTVRVALEASHARRTTDASFGDYRSTRATLAVGLTL